MARILSLVGCTAIPAAAVLSGGHGQPLAPLGASTLATMPMRLYKDDCGRTGHPAALMQVPGAGMEPDAITPFQEVMKDGFYQVECVKDYMLEHGDKFGDNKFAYQLGETSGVSIVHYDLLVAREDQESMTPEVCFKFCRTVPDMLFFGLAHGRDCYCTPYYKPMAGDSSMCDAPCEGDNSVMCGGMAKSTLYEMHACSNTAENVAGAATKLSGMLTTLTEKSQAAEATATSMQGIADALQPGFGKVGDSVASDLLQSAKVSAGKLEASAKAGAALEGEMGTLSSSATTMQAGSIEGSDATIAAEKLVTDIETAVAKSEVAVEEIDGLVSAAAPAAPAESKLAALYYPVMYFVDQSAKEYPSTCGGDAVGQPIVGTEEMCASACETAVGSCVGFSYLAKDASAGLCFLFSKVKTATYYTGCGDAAPAGMPTKEMPTKGMPTKLFLQKYQRSVTNSTGAVADATKCVVKFSSYEGTTLKPDGSGKCEQCLKSATKAERCFE